MSAAIDIASGVLLVVGGLFCIVGGVGLLRMPDFYTRVHAASVTDTLGVGLILLGLVLQAGWTLVAAKL
ncbi:MAG: sodium:proton antiporter, partial [Burkholderiales bacterium]|nr:sodium:proton antiporter [Burkholderiales bacterium]